MSNAEVALRAAKDLNADSLVPETYRSAVDNYFKAKRDYRLKNFDNARKYALRATRLAEQAEFEAYRLGGATPEASTKYTPPEGGTSDAENAFKESDTAPPSNTATVPGPVSPPPPPVTPTPNPLPPSSEGTPKPNGQSGPATPTGSSNVKQIFTTTFPNINVPAGSGLPPVTGGSFPEATHDRESPGINPNQGITIDDMRREETPDRVTGPIRDTNAQSIPDLYGNSKNGGNIPIFGSEGNHEQVGFDSTGTSGMPELNSNAIPTTDQTYDSEDAKPADATKKEDKK